jgi:glutathione S-transferase
LILLIGQFDSPFTRRVGIMMRLYEIPFEHRPWSTFANAEQLAQ